MNEYRIPLSRCHVEGVDPKWLVERIAVLGIDQLREAICSRFEFIEFEGGTFPRFRSGVDGPPLATNCEKSNRRWSP
jgi:hypothetical protein